MSHEPDGEYKWIAHVIDHFSKYNILWPQKTKNMDEFEQGLKERVFSYIGPPNILQLDNSKYVMNNEDLYVMLKVKNDVKLGFRHGICEHRRSKYNLDLE